MHFSPLTVVDILLVSNVLKLTPALSKNLSPQKMVFLLRIGLPVEILQWKICRLVILSMDLKFSMM